ncbi:MAG: DUF192 domain-containing protein [Thermoanaerobacterales bacterium]|nr:DUF192 domain-containing protein [Bacillota bacterium]MDI6906288.1 DUF192 domain-containing protein [Thermoanaerobacterales bacterium]
MRVVDLTLGTDLAVKVEVAGTFGRRLLGLMGRAALAPGTGLLLTPCSNVHTWFMRFPIDLAYLDAGWHVLHTVEALAPFRLGPWVRGTRHVLELPAHRLRETGTLPGNTLRLAD